MDKVNTFIITITGPSQSGKSLVLKKIDKIGKMLQREGYDFYPRLVQKETTRSLRVEEMKAADRGEKLDIKSVDSISEDCDLVYQTYGIRYGVSTQVLKEMLSQGISPYVVVNDIRSVEALKRVFPNQVLSLFLFRKIPDISDFKQGAEQRGNVSDNEIRDRYDKAVAIYRMYIENIALFDRVILNAIEYSQQKLNSLDCIIDKQLYNVIKGVLNNRIRLRQNSATLHSNQPKTFIIAGNSASGKDELVRAIQSMGKLDAEIIPKHTIRKQEKNDESEMICQFIPNQELMQKYVAEYELETKEIMKSLNVVDKTVRNRFRKEWEEMRTKIFAGIETGFDRFWREVSEAKSNERDKYFQPNYKYVNLVEFEQNGKILFFAEEDGSKLIEHHGRIFLIYRANGKLYGFEVSKTISGGRYHVVVASNLGVFNILKQYLGEENVAVIYSHSQISGKEYVRKSEDITAKEKAKAFDKTLNDYVENIVNYDHVVIYAQSQLMNEKSIEEEELIDQMFRLFRVY